MIADAAANLVYVINETDSDLLAISTTSGTVTAHHRFAYSLEDAELFLPADGSNLYLALPSSRKLYTLTLGTLAQTNVVDLDVTIDQLRKDAAASRFK